tara:strand:- start:44 stop:394 length:351 start_codon:yes stop_codon:yes gene_type:complete
MIEYDPRQLDESLKSMTVDEAASYIGSSEIDSSLLASQYLFLCGINKAEQNQIDIEVEEEDTPETIDRKKYQAMCAYDFYTEDAEMLSNLLEFDMDDSIRTSLCFNQFNKTMPRSL